MLQRKLHQVAGFKDNRIFNGALSQPGEFPFMVSIIDKNNEHICGGFIYNARFVITTAYCITKYNCELLTQSTE